jgi:YD repeat-containing protein
MKLSLKSFVLFFSVAFIAISCGGSDNPSPANTTCQLTKATTTSTTGRVSTYKYGGNGKLIEINNKITPTSAITYEETITFTYDASGKLNKRKTTYGSLNSSLEQTMIYSLEQTMIYKSNGQLEKMKQSSISNGTTMENEVLFEYNSSNQVTKMKPSNTTDNTTFAYNGNNLAFYTLVSSGQTIVFEYKGYDNKKNHLNSLAYAFPDQPNYASPNNYTEIVQTLNGQPDGNNRPFFTHTYNSKNLPTKTEFKNGNQTATIVYEYASCQ